MISIVTAYYNRKSLFYETLKSINRSNVKDIELIAVDDGSSSEHRIEDLKSEFPFLKIIRLERESRWYVNPCVPFNIGMRESKGDIIVLQNPECLHVHDVLSYIANNVNETNYVSISAYGLNAKLTELIPTYNDRKEVIDLFHGLPKEKYNGGETLGWYNHSKLRPTYYHFCSAISRSNMAKLNGFDERYAYGIGFDDDEIIIRIRNLGLNMVIADEVSVIHQYHKPVFSQLGGKNHLIINEKTKKENKYSVNLTKLWSGT